MEIKLGDLSPLAGLITKEGAFGKLADSGALGVAGDLYKRYIKDDKSDDVAKESAAKEAALKDAANKEMAALASQYRPRQSEPTGGVGGYKSYKKGGKVSSASKRADGIAVKGKTRGRIV